MDLTLITGLKNKIDAIADIDCTAGLKSAVIHLEAAANHILRGQCANDSAAFTDAIYRANLAFNCCVKEAYRALTGLTPDDKSLTDIENYLTERHIFRSQVLKPFIDYRMTWRAITESAIPVNVSYSEAFIATVTVSSFIVLLIDQINERQAFLASRAKGEICAPLPEPTPPLRADLLSRTIAISRRFCALHAPLDELLAKYSEGQLIAAVHGFITSFAPQLAVRLKSNLSSHDRRQPALVIIHEREKVLFRFKSTALSERLPALVSQTERAMRENAIRHGVLLCCSGRANGLTVEEKALGSSRLAIVSA